MTKKPERQEAIDPAVVDAVGSSRYVAPQPEPEQGRKASPHERKRKARQMSLTFPGPEWKTAIAEQAGRWDMRPSDFVIFAIAHTMQAIEAGEAERPEGEIDTFRHRAGEGLTLPWEP